MSDLPKAAYIPKSRIERIMEDELAKSGLLPKDVRNPAVDIEAFLDRYLQVKLDQHADLEPDVLGVTHFIPGKRPKVEINRDLTEVVEGGAPAWVKGRWRITMAHEAAHVILHAGDVDAAAQQNSLFDEPGQDRPTQLQRCMKRDLHSVQANLDPREIQANFAMAALLMPRDLFTQRAVGLLPSDGNYDKTASSYRAAVEELAHAFQVSREAARIRIEKLGLHSLVGQQCMALSNE